jgi:hypothetical protein
MDEFTKDLFKREIGRQCSYGVSAHREMGLAFARSLSRDPFVTLDPFWFWAQAFLLAAANISKLLWGTKAESAVRRQALRDELETTDESPVRNRAIRNHFEHFDERIEAAAPSGIVIDSNVMPKGAIAIEIEEATERSQLRNYDPSTETLTFWTDEIRAREVVTELVRIGMAAGHFRPMPVCGLSTD